MLNTISEIILLYRVLYIPSHPAHTGCLYSTVCLQRDQYDPYEKHHSTVREACELAAYLNVPNLILYHTEDDNIERRKALYTAEGRLYYKGNLYVPITAFGITKAVLIRGSSPAQVSFCPFLRRIVKQYCLALVDKISKNVTS